ncbi:MAG TPA: hypothetical protein VEB86_01240 [Chryseosolibacter sp.]|nr:hypothetical protein [Chryseosolibacter sp.]
MKTSRLLCLLLITLACEEQKEPTFNVPADDIIQFGKIKELGEEAAKLWPGYDFYRTRPAYIILTDGNGNSARGYVLNPPSPPAGSIKLSEEASHGLDLYSNNDLLASAQAYLGSTLAFLPSTMKVDGVTYFLIKDTKSKGALPFYYDFMDQFDNWLPILTVHEMFHVYQFDQWTFPSDTEQDFNNYPINEDIIALELALFDLMKTVPDVQTPEERKVYLSKFVVLLEELFRVDPTTNNLIQRMVPLELFLEGTARYMEHYACLSTIFPTVDQDVTHGWDEYLATISSDQLIKHIFSIRVWYHVGSGVLRLLEQSDVNFVNGIENGETPYSIAATHVGLTAEEKTDILADIQSTPEWAAQVERAKMLAAL